MLTLRVSLLVQMESRSPREVRTSTVRVWESESGKETATLSGHTRLFRVSPVVQMEADRLGK